MPVGINQWRAGIAQSNYRFQLISLPRVSLVDLLPSVCLAFIYLYLIIGVSVFALPCSVLTAVALSVVTPANYRWHDPVFIYSKISGYGLNAAYSLLYIFLKVLRTRLRCFVYSASCRQQILWKSRLSFRVYCA